MKGLIKKDLLIVKQNLKLILIFTIVFGIFSLEGNGVFYFAPAFVSVMVLMSTFSYDDYNKWDAYAITLPNGRKNVVKSKYIASLIVLILSVLLTYTAIFLSRLINANINISELKESMLGVILAILIIQSVSYPLIFKFGVEKGRIGMGVGVFVLSALLGIIIRNVNFKISPNIIQFFNDYGIWIIPIICIFILWLSFVLSKKIYLKKEF